MNWSEKGADILLTVSGGVITVVVTTMISTTVAKFAQRRQSRSVEANVVRNPVEVRNRMPSAADHGQIWLVNPYWLNVDQQPVKLWTGARHYDLIEDSNGHAVSERTITEARSNLKWIAVIVFDGSDQPSPFAQIFSCVPAPMSDKHLFRKLPRRLLRARRDDV